MRKKLVPLVAATLVATASPTVRADDDDLLFFGVQIEPNVVVMLDDSGSMDGYLDGRKLIDQAKDVVEEIFQEVDGVRFGLFTYDQDADPYTGDLVATVGASTSALVGAVDDMIASGQTPLGRTAQSIQEYYRGEFVEVSGGYWDRQWTGWSWQWVWVPGTPITYPTPIQYACQDNYVIHVTDGFPYPYEGDNSEPLDLIVDVCESMYTSDHSVTFDGVQNIISHTVGFNFEDGVELLTEAADAGGGNFYLAENADELKAALVDALDGIADQTYSFTQASIPSSFVQGGDKAYIASFTSSGSATAWEGALQAYTRASDGTLLLDDLGQPLSSAEAWSAGDLLTAQDPDTRKIYTAVSSTLRSFEVGTSQITAGMLRADDDDHREQIIEFVRGKDAFDRDRDDDTEEDRAFKLGDIFHSSPVLVFPPATRTSDSTYAAFEQTYHSRPKLILVGANDGMLHAFDADTGVERWAFIPPDLLSGLSWLTRTSGDHRYFVDGSPKVADVKIDGSWKTIVMFGERRGGGYYHALDITDTSAAPTYLWSFSDARITESWSDPAIGKIRVDGGGERFVAFFGGGFDTDNHNATGDAMFAVDLDDGSLLWEFDASHGSADRSYMNFSIAATPTLADLDNDGYIDRVYVGDVGGQVWKFDTSAPATISGGKINNWTGKRLFAADVAQQNPPVTGVYLPNRSIHTPISLAKNEAGELWLFFGTGDRNSPLLAASNRLYGLKDDTAMTNGATLDESDLISAQTDDEVTQGWYWPLASREKGLAAATVFDSKVFFSTYTSRLVADCDTPSGYAKLYAMHMGSGHAAIDWDTDTELDEESTDGSEDPSVDIGSGAPNQPLIEPGDGGSRIVTGTTDRVFSIEDLDSSRAKTILYWREVY